MYLKQQWLWAYISCLKANYGHAAVFQLLVPLKLCAFEQIAEQSTTSICKIWQVKLFGIVPHLGA